MPFFFRVPLLKPNSGKKGTLIIKGPLRILVIALVLPPTSRHVEHPGPGSTGLEWDRGLRGVGFEPKTALQVPLDFRLRILRSGRKQQNSGIVSKLAKPLNPINPPSPRGHQHDPTESIWFLGSHLDFVSLPGIPYARSNKIHSRIFPRP